MMETEPQNSKSNESSSYQIPLKDFFSCALSVDCVIFGFIKNDVKVLLIKRGAIPYQGSWALPGDLMYPKEDLDSAAKRVLNDLTGIENLFMEQSSSFGQVNRHPSGRVITVSYYALVNIEDYSPKALSWAENLEWCSLSELPELAFDHKGILDNAMLKLKKDLWSRPIGFNMLPEKFTLNEVQKMFELILDRKFDKANFRKKILGSDFIEPLEELQANVRHRPAQLYTLSQDVSMHELN